MSSEAPEPDRRATAPIRRLRVVPNPTAAPPDGARAAATPIRTGGRHRKPDPDDETDHEIDVEGRQGLDATTDVVPAQRGGWLTVPLPGA